MVAAMTTTKRYSPAELEAFSLAHLRRIATHLGLPHEDAKGHRGRRVLIARIRRAQA